MPKNEKSAAMLRQIESEFHLTRHFTGKYFLAQRVKSAILAVPRHQFVPSDMERSAYLDTPLPIGHGQTISQPFIVALMTDLLCPRENDTILEVGTGCGYQSAILARLAEKVYSIEIIPELASMAKKRLLRLGYQNVVVKEGDGYYGWQEFAPYDGIMVTAATPEIPSALVRQLKAGGKMVLPVGYPGAQQTLIVITKNRDGGLVRQNVLGVSFVPLTRKEVVM